jgi:hypothetical protein
MEELQKAILDTQKIISCYLRTVTDNQLQAAQPTSLLLILGSLFSHFPGERIRAH